MCAVRIDHDDRQHDGADRDREARRGSCTATNVGVGRLTSSVNVVAALSRCTTAQSSVSPLNRRTTPGRHAISGASGQKSEAMRAIIGRPNINDPKNTSASATRGRDGLQEVHERAAQDADDRAHREPDTASCSMPGTPCPLMIRRTHRAVRPRQDREHRGRGTERREERRRTATAGTTVASINDGSDRRPTASSTRSFDNGVAAGVVEGAATSIGRSPTSVGATLGAALRRRSRERVIHVAHDRSEPRSANHLPGEEAERHPTPLLAAPRRIGAPGVSRARRAGRAPRRPCARDSVGSGSGMWCWIEYRLRRPSRSFST